jgi:hypothetical protein
MLDVSRRLRMDEPKLKLKTSLYDPHGRIGADAVDGAVVAASPDQAEAPADLLRESSHVVYCDSEGEISEGFAIALRIMGLKQSQ